MRVKTQAKRSEILEAAAVEFAQRGFHETTLAHVAERMGSSKATIYNYFRSKNALFGAMLAAASVPATAALVEIFLRSAPFSDRLFLFARTYMALQSGERAIALQRLLIAEPDMWRAAKEELTDTTDIFSSMALVDMLREEQARGMLCEGDPLDMLRQLRASLHGDIPHRLLFGEREAFTKAEMDASADAAIRYFLAAYGAR